jgi:hypothetical protein
LRKPDKLLILENEIEAQVLEHALTKRGIPHLIKTYHDSAYDGLFQLQKGWGHLEAPAGFGEEILTIYRELFGKNPPQE